MKTDTHPTCALCLQRLERRRDGLDARSIGVCQPCYDGTSDTARRLHTESAVRTIRKARSAVTEVCDSCGNAVAVADVEIHGHAEHGPFGICRRCSAST
jgi:hypothetical protein